MKIKYRVARLPLESGHWASGLMRAFLAVRGAVFNRDLCSHFWLFHHLEMLAFGLDGWSNDHLGLVKVPDGVGPAHSHRHFQGPHQVLRAVGNRSRSTHYLAQGPLGA